MKKFFKGAKDWFSKLTLKKKIIFGIILVVVIFVIYKFGFASKSAVTYQTTQVVRGTVISTVTESGNVSAANQVSVGSPTDGVIQELYVKNGDAVTAGQNLFKVKSTATPQDKASALASYLNAVSAEKNSESGKVSAQSSLERDRQAVIQASSAVTTMQGNVGGSQPNPATKQSYTQNDIDSINSALTSAQETFKADEAKYNNADTSISASKSSLSNAWYAYQATQDSIVTAPSDGTVANLSVTLGSNVTANLKPTTSSNSSNSSSSSTGTAVLVLGDYSNLIIATQVNEIDIASVKPDENATITLDALPNVTFVGKVYSVDSVGTITSGVVTYNVYIKMISPPDTIHSGMTASAVIQTNLKDNVLTVPSAAVTTTSGQSYVKVMDKNKQVTQTPVEIGISSDSDTEIVSGLTEGQTVVTSSSTSAASGTSSTASPFSAIGGRGGFGGSGGGGGAAVRRGN